MNVELQALENNGTWSILFLSPGKHPIGWKWVCKIKFRANGTVERHKVHIVAKGYTQQEGIDFLDIFSLVEKLVTVKVLLFLAAIYDWFLTQLDVSNTFLHGDLIEEVYMIITLGYTC